MSGEAVVTGTSAGMQLYSTFNYGEGIPYGYVNFNGLAEKTAASKTGLRDDRRGSNSLDYDDNGGYIRKTFGFVDEYLFDPHCAERGRVARQLVALKVSGFKRGFCVDQNTGLLFVAGKEAVVYGAGVSFVNTATATFPTSRYFEVKNARVSHLTNGDKVDLTTGKITSTKNLIKVPSNTRTFVSKDIFASFQIIQSLRNLIDSSFVGGSRGTATIPSGYPSSAPAFEMFFTKDSLTKGYLKDDVYTVENALVEIY